MKLTKSKLKQLIKEEIKAVREGYFGRKISDDNVNIFDPNVYKGMFDSEVLDTFEDSLREFISAYLDEKDQMTLGNNKIKKLKTAVMTALENAEEADPGARIIVKTALEDVEAANGTGDLKLGI